MAENETLTSLTKEGAVNRFLRNVGVAERSGMVQLVVPIETCRLMADWITTSRAPKRVRELEAEIEQMRAAS